MSEEERLDTLLAAAKAGMLLQSQLDEVAASLRDSPAGEHAYIRLHIVGRGLGTSYEELVAGFLVRPDDPMLSGLALRTLCGWWSLAGEYLAHLKEFMAGVGWDEMDDVRLIAISESGEYLRDADDRELQEGLLEIAGDSNDEVNQATAIAALARALGDDWPSFPEYGGPLPKPDWERDVLTRAYARYLATD